MRHSTFMLDRLKFHIDTKTAKERSVYCHCLWKIITPFKNNDVTNICRYICPHAYTNEPWQCYQYRGNLLK